MPGKGSLNLAADSIGEEGSDVGVRTAGELTVPNATWWRGEAGRRLREMEPVPLYKPDSGEGWRGPGLGVSSSSASSEMSHTLGVPAWAYVSSYKAGWLRGLRVRLGDRSGDEDRPGTGDGDKARWPEGLMTEGREWARIMGGALGELDPLCERR